MLSDAVIELKPRGVMELFDQAFRLYRNNFVKFVGIIAVAEVPLQLVQMLVNLAIYQSTANSTDSSSSLSSAALGSTVVNLIVALLSYIFVSGLATAALTRAIADTYLGEPISIGGAYSKIKGLWGALLLALLLGGLLSVLLFIWTIIPCIGWLTGFGMIFFMTVVMAQLIAPIVVIERSSASRTLRRAWEMARRRFWWLTGFFLLLLLFNFLVIQGPVQIVTAVIQSYFIRGASSANLASATALQSISTSILTLVLSLLYYPLASACSTLAYFDLRVRQEGLDLAVMANQSVNTPASVVELASQTAVTPSGPLVTCQEMGYFALFSLIGAGIYAVIIGFIMLLSLIIAGGRGL